jgi:hypothetical protein
MKKTKVVSLSLFCVNKSYEWYCAFEIQGTCACARARAHARERKRERETIGGATTDFFS